MQLNTNKNINILILGGSGFIGSNLTEFFVNAGKKVIVFDQKQANWKNLKSIDNKIKIIKGNFDNSKTLEKIFKENKIDVVIHLISSILPSTPFGDVIKKMELVSTMELLNIMNKNGVKNIVYFSSGGTVYGANGKTINSEMDETKPINLYGWLKLTIEKYIQMYSNISGINYIILRPSNPYGKKQNIYSPQGIIAIILGYLISNKPVEIQGDGKTIRDYLYIDDLCQAVLLLIENNRWNNIYNIGSGKGTSVNEIIEIIKKITKINFNTKYNECRKIDIPVNILDISKIKNDVNWESLIELENGISKMWRELKK